MKNPSEALPQHIAIIMDGNNRWSKLQSDSAISGHRAGATAARDITYLCADKNIDVLTLFVFSSENWLRPKKEVNGLMALFLRVLKKKEVSKLHEKNIRLKFIGDRSRFSEKLQSLMHEAELMTESNLGLTVVIAANYGGQWDITNAVKSIASKIESGEVNAAQVDQALVEKHISTGDLPMPDLCIRTGGDQRISNFLLWQFAYTELYFSDALWPDFNAVELDKALQSYASRQRRYGMASEQVGGS